MSLKRIDFFKTWTVFFLSCSLFFPNYVKHFILGEKLTSFSFIGEIQNSISAKLFEQWELKWFCIDFLWSFGQLQLMQILNFICVFNVSLTKVGQNCSNMPKERSKTNQNIEYSVRSKTKKIRQINTNYSATLENIKFSRFWRKGRLIFDSLNYEHKFLFSRAFF